MVSSLIYITKTIPSTPRQLVHQNIYIQAVVLIQWLLHQSSCFTLAVTLSTRWLLHQKVDIDIKAVVS